MPLGPTVIMYEIVDSNIVVVGSSGMAETNEVIYWRRMVEKY